MSKYIIELDYDLQRVVGVGVKQGTVWVKDYDVDDLEELCADYINEHFGDLQDTAYQRGLEEGKKATWELVADASNAEYQKGLNDAWECAIHKGCEGCKYETIKGGTCVMCCNNYKNQWTAKEKDDEIKVGDIVERYLNGKLDGTGIYLGEDGDYWNCLFWTGTVFGTFAYPKNQFKKTGRHVDITDILKGALE